MVVATAVNASVTNSVTTNVIAVGGGAGSSFPPADFVVAALDAVKPEGNSGTVALTFTVTRTENLSSAYSQNWYVYGTTGSPATGSDFAGGVYATGTVEFAVGETTKIVTINVAGDTLAETDEQFVFSLVNNYAALGSPFSLGPTPPAYAAQGTILNDDAPIATTFNLSAGITFYEYIPGLPQVTTPEI